MLPIAQLLNVFIRLGQKIIEVIWRAAQS